MNPARSSPTAALARSYWLLVIPLIVVVAAPFARTVIGGDSPIAASVFMLIIFTELLTAFVLFQRYLADADRSLYVLAVTYLASALLFGARQIVAPNAFGEVVLVKAAQPVGMWLWILAHTVFPIGIVLSIALRSRTRRPTAVDHRRQYWAIAAAIALAALAVSGLTAWLIHVFSGPPMEWVLPMQWIKGGEGPPAFVINAVILPFVALIAFRGARRGGTIDRWILIALSASIADVVLTMLGKYPYTVGWYAGRLLNVTAASILLIGMVAEISHLYRKLAVAHNRLRIKATYDMLTGTLTRGAVMKEVDGLLHANDRNRSAGSLAIFDIDHFKQINDQHGHLVGDRVLAELGARMLSALRHEERIGRYGGDEFILLVPANVRDDGEAIANRILKVISAAPIELPIGSLHVTASVGITRIEPSDENVDTVFERADAALYVAKARGRNRAVADNDELWSTDGLSPPEVRSRGHSPASAPRPQP